MREIDIWCRVFDVKGFVIPFSGDGYLEYQNPELYTGFNFEVYFNKSTGEVTSVFVNGMNIKSAFFEANRDVFRNVKISQIV